MIFLELHTSQLYPNSHRPFSPLSLMTLSYSPDSTQLPANYRFRELQRAVLLKNLKHSRSDLHYHDQ